MRILFYATALSLLAPSVQIIALKSTPSPESLVAEKEFFPDKGEEMGTVPLETEKEFFPDEGDEVGTSSSDAEKEFFPNDGEGMGSLPSKTETHSKRSTKKKNNQQKPCTPKK